MRRFVPFAAVASLVVLGAPVAMAAAQQAPLVMTVAPTHGPAGTALTFTPTDPCPVDRTVPSPTVDLTAAAGGSTLASSPVDANGNWSIDYTVPAGTSPGSLSFVVTCQGQSVSGGNVVLGVYGAVAFTVDTTTTTTSTTSTTAPAGPTVKVATPNVVQGGPIDVTSAGWEPGATITITLNSTPVQVGTAVADAVGNVATQVFVPIDFPVGAHTLTLAGTTLAGVAGSVSTSINVSAAVSAIAQAATSSTPTAVAAVSTTSGSLPVTGRTTAPLAATGLLLLVGGATLVLAGRRRRALVLAVDPPRSDDGSPRRRRSA